MLRNPRFAGEVSRYHTWPILRPQSNAEHTWQVLRIYYQIFGDLPAPVAIYILWHDAGEMVAGDLPFPVKSRNPLLKQEIDRLEQEALASMGVELPAVEAVALFKTRVKCADILEMWEKGRSELLLGNKFAQPIVDDTRDALNRLAKALPQAEQDLIAAYVTRMSKLLEE